VSVIVRALGVLALVVLTLTLRPGPEDEREV